MTQTSDPSKKRSVYTRIALVTCVALLLLLGAFQSIWVLSGSGTGIMNQVGSQKTRIQAITKNVLILAYRPVSEHPQAVSELQNVLPVWERTQNGLKVGDDTLQLPRRVPDDVQQLLTQAQPDYISIDTAAHVILAHADMPTDPLQVAIIVSHERAYTLAMSQVVSVWQQRIDGAFLHLYWIESGIGLAIIALIILIAILTSKQIKSPGIPVIKENL